MTEFFVGQKVVCVDADSILPGCERGNWPIITGRIYTIRRVGLFDHWVRGNTLHLWLEGIIRPGKNRGKSCPDVPFFHTRFRPLESKAIEIFRKIAEDVSNGKAVEIVDA